MLAAFATLTFLIAMWLCMIVVAGMLEHSGPKIVAALKSHSQRALPTIPPIQVRVSQRYYALSLRPMQTQAGLRAAA